MPIWVQAGEPKQRTMPNGRIIGMSSLQKPRRLLNNIRGKPAKTKSPKAVAIDDPPVSTDDDEDKDGNEQKISKADHGLSGKHGPGSGHRGDAILDSSGDERVDRACIKPTDFGKPAQSDKLPRGTRGESGDCQFSEGEKNKQPGQARVPSKKRRRQNDNPGTTYERGKGMSSPLSRPGDHCTDERGFIKRPSSKATYGKGNVGIGSRGRPGKNVGAASKPSRQVSDPTDKAEGAKKSELRIPDGAALSSPPRSTSARLNTNHMASDVLHSSPEKKPIFKYRSSGSTEKRPRRKPARRIDPPSPSLPRAIFKMPAQLPDLGHRTGDNHAKLDDALLDAASDEEGASRLSGMEVMDDSAAPATVCPWCGEPVDKTLLDEFSKGKRMNVRLQTRFCQKHRKQTAMETWQAKSYPTVDWQDLDRRFSAHHGFLLEIVNGKSSHFRSALAEKIKSGQARSMKREENLNPGYYGPRGFNLMCDYLVSEFGELLKEKAVSDRVIAGRGSAAFIQSVLVAELAVQLIKKDMGVSAEEARSIMEESKALGEMVHEET